MIEIHQLQKDTAPLLNALYLDDHLPLTPAMLKIQNSYYPDLNSILATLTDYKDIERVKAFVDQNSELIGKTIKELAEEELKLLGTAESGEGEDIFSSFFESRKSSTVFEKIKSISFKDIEACMSEVLSDKLDDQISVSIKEVKLNNSEFLGNVSINIELSKTDSYTAL